VLGLELGGNGSELDSEMSGNRWSPYSNCQLSNRVKNAVDSLLNIGAKILKFLTSNVMHNAEKLVWTIRILLECLQHVLKMYAWSLSENQASIQFKCRFIGLMLKQLLFRKHDFAALVHRIYHDHQNWCFLQLKKHSNNSHTHIKEEHSDKSTRFHFYGGGKTLIFSSDELRPYVLSYPGIRTEIIIYFGAPNRSCESFSYYVYGPSLCLWNITMPTYSHVHMFTYSHSFISDSGN
jgi:hypothetical protein